MARRNRTPVDLLCAILDQPEVVREQARALGVVQRQGKVDAYALLVVVVLGIAVRGPTAIAQLGQVLADVTGLRRVVERLFATVENHVEMFDARSSLAKAMRYLLNQREPLSLFLKDPAVPIHNHLSERALRGVALLRKTALFVGSDEGGAHLAMLLSTTATCQMHGVDPERWLADVRIGIQDETEVETLLPWTWKTGRGATFKPAYDTT